MLNTLIGALITVCFFCTHFLAYHIGRRQKKADIVEKLSREEQEAAEKQMKGLENIMNYDYNIAIGRKH